MKNSGSKSVRGRDQMEVLPTHLGIFYFAPATPQLKSSQMSPSVPPFSLGKLHAARHPSHHHLPPSTPHPSAGQPVAGRNPKAVKAFLHVPAENWRQSCCIQSHVPAPDSRPLLGASCGPSWVAGHQPARQAALRSLLERTEALSSSSANSGETY